MSIQRSHSSDTVSWTGMIGDLSLAVFKGAVGYFSGSKALLGDALYSASDAVSALNRLIPRRPSVKGWGTSKQPSRAHRTEPIFAILFAVLVLMGGLQIAVASIREIALGKIHVPDQFAMIAIFVSLAVKEAIFQFQYRYSKKQGDGQYTVYAEEHRFSLYTSLTVCVGVFLSVAGDSLGWKAMMYMDPISALIVACFVTRKGYLLITKSVYGSLVQEAEQEDAISFIETVQRVHGIITVDDLKAREQGHYVTVDLKISVNPRITVLEANEIAERAKKLLMHRFVHISDVNIQVVPYDPGYPYKSNHQLTDNEMPTLLQ
ncbi:cation diffusion facilitator family transporter [Paenibacillus sp. HJL G12]|uniref:Cation diffusion facilitator family transporter n=1 Tax=Paenibacillus dendrobii TaxID=2691084 RepID=A0A7X3LIR5_9BACL|nr:cation diffusion facilitator family transporter [Paenibacillus dendrobii]MWV45500.1 cation diffusion facilitator family transporter [Paenibacillus dendrobii]